MQSLNQYLPYGKQRKRTLESKIPTEIRWKPINPSTFKLKKSIRRDLPLKIEEINQHYLKKIDFDILKSIPQENLEFIDTALASIHHKIGKKNLTDDYIQKQCLLLSSFMITSLIGLQYPGSGTVASFLIQRTLDKSIKRKLTKFIDNTFSFISKTNSLIHNLDMKNNMPYLSSYRDSIVKLINQIEYYFLITIQANKKLTKDQKNTLTEFVRFQLDYALAKIDNQKPPKKDKLTHEPIKNSLKLKPARTIDQEPQTKPNSNPIKTSLPKSKSPYTDAVKKLKELTKMKNNSQTKETHLE